METIRRLSGSLQRVLSGDLLAGRGPPSKGPGDESEEEPDPVRDIEAEAQEAEKIAQMKARPRRSGVSGEAPTLDPDWVPPKHPKDAATRARLLAMIEANRDCQVLVGHLGEAALGVIVDAFFPRLVLAGQAVITQGEEGDNFYVVDSGRFDITVTRGDPPVTHKVASAEPGSFFGQLALLYNAPRAATCTAAEDSAVWAMDRATFRAMLISGEATKKKTYEAFLEGVEMLQHLNGFERAQVADLLEPETYAAGDAIVVQGSPGDAFFFIEAGTAHALIAGDQGEVEVLKYDTPGQFFGEIALLTCQERAATVRAGDGGCAVLRLQKEHFERCFVPLADSMRANVDRYPKYVEFAAAAGL